MVRKKRDSPSLVDRIKDRYTVDPVTECWNFDRPDADGYGRIGFRYRTLLVHRVAAAVWRGFDLDSDLLVLHSCDNKRCINPDHLYFGTTKDNANDAVERGQIPVGEAHHSAILTEDQAIEILRLSSSGMNTADIARQVEVRYDTAYAVVTGRTWGHLQNGGYRYERIDMDAHGLEPGGSG